MAFDFNEVRDAYERIRPYVRRTLLEESFYLGDGERRYFFKLESLQRAKSFKIRGALNKMLTLTAEEAARGVGTVSSGNHGSSVSYAASLLGIENAVVIVPEGSEVTLDNVGEYMIGTQRGTTGFQYATDDYGQDHVIGYDNGATAVQELLNGTIDAVIIDNEPAKAYVAANEGLTILDGAWVEEDYCAAVDEGNTVLLDAINAALNEMITDGTVQTIVDKYITAE